MTSLDPLTFVPLHPLEFRILLAVLDGPVHGYRIVKEIEEREARRTVYPANLYRRIRDLAARELLEVVAPPPNEPDPDPRRKYFRATALGRRVARAEAARLQDLVVDARARDLLEPA